MSKDLFILQGLPYGGETTLVLMTLYDCIVNIPEIATRQRCYKHTVTTITVPTSRFLTVQIERNGHLAQSYTGKMHPEIDLGRAIIRSCDNSIITFRSRMIDALKEAQPQTLITIGDIVYADFFIGHRGPQWVNYCTAWCRTLCDLIPITINCCNLFIPDDHEVYDNMTADRPGELGIYGAGHRLMAEVYRGLVEKFYSGMNITEIAPQHNYTFPIRNVRVILLGSRDSKSKIEFVSQVLPACDEREVLILTNVCHIMLSPSLFEQMFYACTRCQSETLVDSSKPLIETLSKSAIAKRIVYVGGDYHRMLSGNMDTLQIRVTSPFSGVDFYGSPAVMPLNNFRSETKCNFYHYGKDMFTCIPYSNFETVLNYMVILGRSTCI